ncbi:hypothetical protein UlMin_027179 [Ulmus minor]
MKLLNRRLYVFLSMCFHVILLYFLKHTIAINALGSETDRLAFLDIKKSLSGDPKGVLSSWNDSVHFCNWNGITCSHRHQRITGMNLQSYDIDNLLEGKIPANSSYCSELTILNLRSNRLTGMIPSKLGSLVNLEVLNLGTNNLTGESPPSLGNISSLRQFSIVYNNLAGTVPDELGRLKSLSYFAIGPNNLSGTIPLSLYNISSMSTFSLTDNQFSGTLPPNIGLTLPNLQTFGIGGNEFSGTIPESFSNSSQLQILDIAENNFAGQVPGSLGNLVNLRWLGLSNNNLGNYSSNSLDFVASLTNCSSLEILDLSLNNFAGVLPGSVANLSTQITKLYLGVNRISGTIPATLENLGNLIVLGMQDNLFKGVIPASLGQLQKLQILGLEWNSLSGKIPSSIGNLTQMFQLYLSHNKLEGNIPRTIADCQSLQYIDISQNSLSGAIPQQVFGIFSLSLLLNLSRNSLTGSIPVEVGKLKNINALDLSENNLTGEIPESIGDCQSLEFFYLQGNFFQGNLPSALASLNGLRYLDLSRNNLTGKILKDLEKLRFLLYLNLSFNALEGEVPNKGIFQNSSAVSLVGNSKLCGGVPKLQVPLCPQKLKTSVPKLTIIIICVAAAASLLLLSSFIVLFWKRKSKRESSSAISTVNFLSKVSYKRLHQATNGFSPSMLIGTGGFGSVYRGILDQEEANQVAVKVLNLRQKGASKSFIAECNALRNIRHRNLVKIITCCSSMDYKGNEFKALVFEYMSNGSLEKWFNSVSDSENRSRNLNLLQRLNIAIDVASALHYLHHHCEPPIIHRDLKSSNVLLDNEMVARVSDFGLAKLVSTTSTDFSASETSTAGLKGTIGYAAPEYAMGSEPSSQGDVYSYGILVLEMFTGRKPTDGMFEDGFNLHNFEIVDSELLPREEGGETEEARCEIEETKKMSFMMERMIGVACSEESPKERLNMEIVSRKLQQINNDYVGVGIRGQRSIIN